MATEKLAEGIRLFAADSAGLTSLVQKSPWSNYLRAPRESPFESSLEDEVRSEERSGVYLNQK